MKKRTTVIEVIALAVSGACVTAYSYIIGYMRGKINTAVEVGEEAVSEHVDDIISEAEETESETE